MDFAEEREKELLKNQICTDVDSIENVDLLRYLQRFIENMKKAGQ